MGHEPDGHTGRSSRCVSTEGLPLDALKAWERADLDPWDQTAALALQSRLEVDAWPSLVGDKIKERGGGVDGERREEEEDSLNVDELSELFSCVEQEEASGVDYSVFVEDEDANNVEEISELLSCLEDSKKETEKAEAMASPLAVDIRCDSQPTEDEFELDLFSKCQQAVADAKTGQEPKQASVDAANVDTRSEALRDEDAGDLHTPLTTAAYSVADCDDVKNVNLVADLFTSLEANSDASRQVANESSLVTRDWIDALEVDNVASLFAELEQADALQKEAETPVSAASAKMDSRIFVPTFSVRIDNQQPGRRPAIGVNSDLLVGPPCAMLAGPPASTRTDRVDRWQSKRKTRSLATKQPDPSISECRRASAAKRQRVKGRFVRDKTSFVSITALQQ